MRCRTDCRGWRAVRAITEPRGRKCKAEQGNDECHRCNQEPAAPRLGGTRRHRFVLQSRVNQHGDPLLAKLQSSAMFSVTVRGAMRSVCDADHTQDGKHCEF